MYKHEEETGKFYLAYMGYTTYVCMYSNILGFQLTHMYKNPVCVEIPIPLGIYYNKLINPQRGNLSKYYFSWKIKSNNNILSRRCHPTPS